MAKLNMIRQILLLGLISVASSGQLPAFLAEIQQIASGDPKTTFDSNSLLFPLLKQCSPSDYFFFDPLDLLRDKYRNPRIPHGTGSSMKFENFNINFYWDFIIVGAGSAGSALASRLSENGKYSVLVIEAGKPEMVLTDIPALPHFFQGSSYDWAYKTEPIPGRFMAYKDGKTSWARGKAVGGTSVLNYMIYTRGHRFDWDRIASAGNPGWGWNDMLAYYLKSEKADLGTVSDNPSIHNKNGLLSIQYPRFRKNITADYRKAAEELGLWIEDYNDGNPRGFAYVQTHTKDGHRNSAARAYLYPFVKNRTNLDIFYDCTVTKVNIVNNAATSVTYMNNGRTFTAYANKEVIMSAGAIASPQLLMLSGLGPASHLQEIGIPLIKDLKVGETMYDHGYYPGLIFRINITDSLYVNVEKDASLPLLLEWFKDGTGPLTVIGALEGLGYLKTSVSTDTENVPDIEYVFASGGIASDGSQTLRKNMNIDQAFFDQVFGEIIEKPAFSIFPVLMHPKSKGYIKLRDKNYASHPKIYYDFYSDSRDLETMLEGIKKTIAFTKTNAFQRVGATLHNKPFPMCSSFVFDSDDYWRCCIKSFTTTMWHPIATCKMGPSSDPTAVVDPQLKVYGIAKLRVCDASIIPSTLTAHTNAPSIVVGEKCADLIKFSHPV